MWYILLSLRGGEELSFMHTTDFETNTVLKFESKHMCIEYINNMDKVEGCTYKPIYI